MIEFRVKSATQIMSLTVMQKLCSLELSYLFRLNPQINIWSQIHVSASDSLTMLAQLAGYSETVNCLALYSAITNIKAQQWT